MNTNLATRFSRGQWVVYMLIDSKRMPAGVQKQGDRTLYVGMTNNLSKRLTEHNNGDCPATKHTTWKLVAVCALNSRQDVACLESWLKTGNTRQKRQEFGWLYGEEDTTVTSEQKVNFLKKAFLWKGQRQLRAAITTDLDHKFVQASRNEKG